MYVRYLLPLASFALSLIAGLTGSMPVAAQTPVMTDIYSFTGGSDGAFPNLDNWDPLVR